MYYLSTYRDLSSTTHKNKHFITYKGKLTLTSAFKTTFFVVFRHFEKGASFHVGPESCKHLLWLIVSAHLLFQPVVFFVWTLTDLNRKCWMQTLSWSQCTTKNILHLVPTKMNLDQLMEISAGQLKSETQQHQTHVWAQLSDSAKAANAPVFAIKLSDVPQNFNKPPTFLNEPTKKERFKGYGSL